MRTLASYLVLLTLLFNPLFSYSSRAADLTAAEQALAAKVTNANAFKVAVGNVTYGIQQLPAMLKDLENVNLEAKEAIGAQVADDIHKRFSAAMQVLTVMSLDTSIPEADRADMSADIASALGEVLFTVIRHQGEDLIKITDEVSDIRSAGMVVREFFLDGKNLVVPKKTIDGKIIWGPLDRLKRDRLGQKLVGEMQSYATNVIPKMDRSGKLDDANFKFWSARVVAKAMTIRRNRLAAQYATASTYVGMALVGFFMPVVDSVSFFDGGASGNSLFVSGVMYATAWMVIGMYKWASTSGRILLQLRDTMKYLAGETPAVKDDLNKSMGQKILDWAKRLPQVQAIEAARIPRDTVGMFSCPAIWRGQFR